MQGPRLAGAAARQHQQQEMGRGCAPLPPGQGACGAKVPVASSAPAARHSAVLLVLHTGQCALGGACLSLRRGARAEHRRDCLRRHQCGASLSARRAARELLACSTLLSPAAVLSLLFQIDKVEHIQRVKSIPTPEGRRAAIALFCRQVGCCALPRPSLAPRPAPG